MTLLPDIYLNEEEMEDVKRLQRAMKKENPSMYSDYTIGDVVQYVANSGFNKSLQERIKFYEGELAKNEHPYESANSGCKSK